MGKRIERCGRKATGLKVSYDRRAASCISNVMELLFFPQLCLPSSGLGDFAVTTGMIVDDSALMRRMIRSVLEAAGLQVVYEAGSGEEAVDNYLRISPSIVTMDITMTGIDGIEATRQILDLDSNAKIVMVTAMATSYRLEDAFEAGAKGLVVKPFSPAQCAMEINRVLNIKSI